MIQIAPSLMPGAFCALCVHEVTTGSQVWMKARSLESTDCMVFIVGLIMLLQHLHGHTALQRISRSSLFNVLLYSLCPMLLNQSGTTRDPRQPGPRVPPSQPFP